MINPLRAKTVFLPKICNINRFFSWYILIPCILYFPLFSKIDRDPPPPYPLRKNEKRKGEEKHWWGNAGMALRKNLGAILQDFGKMGAPYFPKNQYHTQKIFMFEIYFNYNSHENRQVKNVIKTNGVQFVYTVQYLLSKCLKI